MLNSFTRNYEDNSTEAGFQFTFFCDCCNNGFRSTFIESTTYKKSRGLKTLSEGAYALGSLVGRSNAGWSIGRGVDVLSDRFDGRSPQWQKEHEQAFLMAQDEARRHFIRCQACQTWVCDTCYNEQEGLCIQCAPRQDVYVAQARSAAMKRNIDEAAETATVWQGQLESKTTVCPACGAPATSGKFCNSCGAPLSRPQCPACGAEIAAGMRFCNECGANLAAAPVSNNCPNCGKEMPPGVKFCGGCGTKLR